ELIACLHTVAEHVGSDLAEKYELKTLSGAPAKPATPTTPLPLKAQQQPVSPPQAAVSAVAEEAEDFKMNLSRGQVFPVGANGENGESLKNGELRLLNKYVAAYLGTDVGKDRKANEDNMGYAVSADGTLRMVVCDGMGGHAAGEVASALAVSIM